MSYPDASSSTLQLSKAFIFKLGGIPIFLLFCWICAVLWGEGTTYSSHIFDCRWDSWETWKEGARPHHVLLIADPQLVDPHTYPDRPWPLSTLTILYTDLYLKRAYRRLLDQLQPDTVLFLGDLFDGGREWGNGAYKSPDEQYQQYGQDFWMQEYERFQNMFVRTWRDHGMAQLAGEGGRRFIASLPGNHDLGFAGGIDLRVRSRFEAHFGPTNRMDILGNHSFVSLDTVSLSAMDQIDINTGASGIGDKSAKAQSSRIWQPVQSFLDDASVMRQRKVKQEVLNLGSRTSYPEPRERATQHLSKPPHDLITLGGEGSDAVLSPPAESPRFSTPQFPTVILTHVPLYRSESSHCGPSRERGTAIPVHAGYQYQNVLTPLISRDIVEKLDASQITQIYSGDDHDYCEIEHDEFTGRIREITVKSMSWAMGVRRPGVQLVSLWNPVDLAEVMVETNEILRMETPSSMPRGTVQNHLCLLPDQLGIFLTYAKLLAFTLISLIIRAARWKPTTQQSQSDLEKDGAPLLPLTKVWSGSKSTSKRAASPPTRSYSPPANGDTSTLSASSVTARKSGSNLGGYGNIPAQSRSRTPSPFKPHTQSGFTADSDDWGMPTNATDRVVYAQTHHDPNRSMRNMLEWIWIFKASRSKWQVFLKSVVVVATPTLLFYGWSLWTDI